jgi:hypothetical protein
MQQWIVLVIICQTWHSAASEQVPDHLLIPKEAKEIIFKRVYSSHMLPCTWGTCPITLANKHTKVSAPWWDTDYSICMLVYLLLSPSSLPSFYSLGSPLPTQLNIAILWRNILQVSESYAIGLHNVTVCSRMYYLLNHSPFSDTLLSIRSLSFLCSLCYLVCSVPCPEPSFPFPIRPAPHGLHHPLKPQSVFLYLHSYLIRSIKAWMYVVRTSVNPILMPVTHWFNHPKTCVLGLALCSPSHTRAVKVWNSFHTSKQVFSRPRIACHDRDFLL